MVDRKSLSRGGPPRSAALNRRKLLGVTVLLGVPASAAAAQVIRGEDPWSGQTDAPQTGAGDDSYVFFSGAESAFVEAAVDRMIPPDDLGPGGKEAGVVQFIDRQLNGDFGKAERWYMAGPWKKGQDSQGYQSRMTPAKLYQAAIKAIDKTVSDEGKADTFAGLKGEDQDDFLKRLENGDVALEGADAKTFWDMFYQNVMEGFWADPIYGGNRDMAGWKLIGYPGARYDKRDWVLKHNQPYPLGPVGIAGRPEWTGGS